MRFLASLSFLLLLSLLFLSVDVFGQSCNPTRTAMNEEISETCYFDSEGIETIGVGFNLRRPNAKQTLTRFTGNPALYDRIIADCQRCKGRPAHSCRGTIRLDRRIVLQIYETFDYPEAERCAREYLGNVRHTGNVFRAITDMAFNLGCPRLKGFEKMKAALDRKDYGTAMHEAWNSLWCKQVGNRCPRTAGCILTGEFRRQSEEKFRQLMQQNRNTFMAENREELRNSVRDSVSSMLNRDRLKEQMRAALPQVSTNRNQNGDRRPIFSPSNRPRSGPSPAPAPAPAPSSSRGLGLFNWFRNRRDQQPDANKNKNEAELDDALEDSQSNPEEAELDSTVSAPTPLALPEPVREPYGSQFSSSAIVVDVEVVVDGLS